jgi:sulfite reductase beta subunit-like hemoprotein
VSEGEFVCVIGHSGCGKSTVLPIVMGLNEPTEGGMILAGREVVGPGTDRGVVFQSHALFPWLTARGNVLLAVEQVNGRHGRAERRRLADHYLALVGLAEVERAFGSPLSPTGVDARHDRSTDHVGIFRQTGQGLNYVRLSVPVGRLTDVQVFEVCRLAERYGTGEVRLTPGQNVIIPHVPDQKLGETLGEPLLQVLRYDPSAVMRGLVSCTGIEFCNLAVIETKKRALEIARTLEQNLGAVKPITIAWSGCPAGCGNHHVADIGLQGTKAKVDGKVVDAVTIFVEANRGRAPGWLRRSWKMSRAMSFPRCSSNSCDIIRANPPCNSPGVSRALSEASSLPLPS